MDKIEILGIGISCASSYDEVYMELINLIKKNVPAYVTVNNVHTIVQAVLEKQYGEILNNSILSIPDGKPLSLIARIKGRKNISRIFGPTLMEYTLNKSRADNISHFFFGSAPSTLEQLKINIQTKYPSIKIAGMISPPFRELSGQENINFVEIINKSRADIIWIGLGAPKQEKWIYQNYRKLNKGIMIGIGAGFDYVAGNTKHAPEWMKNMSLEWFYRLLQEPKRLWKRYLVTNTLFLFFLTLELFKLKKFKD